MAAGVAYAVFSSWELLPTGVPPTVVEAVLYLEVSAATALAVTLVGNFGSEKVALNRVLYGAAVGAVVAALSDLDKKHMIWLCCAGTMVRKTQVPAVPWTYGV